MEYEVVRQTAKMMWLYITSLSQENRNRIGPNKIRKAIIGKEYFNTPQEAMTHKLKELRQQETKGLSMVRDAQEDIEHLGTLAKEMEVEHESS